MADAGRASRHSRLAEDHSGAWSSSSQDFVRLAGLLYSHSANYAKASDGNCSIYALAGIPTLFGGLHSLLVELNAGLYGQSRRRENLKALADTPNDVSFIEKHYDIENDLRARLQLLLQVRHEITHPAQMPGPEGGGTPDYLDELKKWNLLQSTGADADYVWLAQLQSHKLFTWAWETMEEVVAVLLKNHDVTEFSAAELSASWAHFRDTAAP